MNTSFNPLPPGYTHVQHTFEPVFDEHSRILILGSFPSVKSREIQFYYGHPQNRFWKLMAQPLEVPIPQSKNKKKTMLLTLSFHQSRKRGFFPGTAVRMLE